jgi:hypothetical protein
LRFSKELSKAGIVWPQVLNDCEWSFATEAWLQIAGHYADSCIKEEWKLVRGDWHDFVKGVMEAGSGIAHKLGQATHPWAHVLVTGPTGLTSQPQHVLGAELEAWSKLWQVGKQAETIHWAPEKMLQIISVEGLRRAARKFKINTSQPDGWHPRHLGLMSKEAVGGLCWLYFGMEKAGDAPAMLRSLLVRLLPKPDQPTRRPIGLYRSFTEYGHERGSRWSRLGRRPSRTLSSTCSNEGMLGMVCGEVWSTGAARRPQALINMLWSPNGTSRRPWSTCNMAYWLSKVP